MNLYSTDRREEFGGLCDVELPESTVRCVCGDAVDAGVEPMVRAADGSLRHPDCAEVGR